MGKKEEPVKQEKGPLNALFDKAEKEKQTQPVSVKIVQFREAGESLTGIYQGSEEMPESKYGGTVRIHFLATDMGLCSCILGASADKNIGARVVEGDLIRLTYRGKEDLADGRTVNVFDVVKALVPAEVSDGKDQG